MSLTGVTMWLAIATSVLAIGAGVTALYAAWAFSKQKEEVKTIEDQAKAQHDFMMEQSKVLQLQAKDIQASLEQRERDTDQQRRSQAAKVTAWIERVEDGSWKAHIRNASDLLIFDVRTFYHEIRKKPGEGWDTILQGGPPPRDETICVLPANADRLRAVPEKVRALFQELTDRTCVVSIEFTDAAENRWERNPRGALVPACDDGTFQS
jgi:hypothetical protein